MATRKKDGTLRAGTKVRLARKVLKRFGTKHPWHPWAHQEGRVTAADTTGVRIQFPDDVVVVLNPKNVETV